MLGTLLGNYRVVSQLGAGGMGVVYLGRHETLGHRVVVKVLKSELSGNADMVQRFFNEARAATAIHSPGIVQIFDFGNTPDGRAYFAMEMLDGESLAARLKRQRPDHGDCCRIGRQVANVLQAAHAAGITHRDLKPANLFLVRDPEVAGGERLKVLDFGIAKLAGDTRFVGIKTDTDLIMGTPYYMSPEQCRSASTADARSDIYSLGCILFEIACGRPPFVFPGMADIVAAHLHEPPPYPKNLSPDMPPGLSALIARMLSKHPDARPQTMTAVGKALDEILHVLERSSPQPAPGPTAARAPSAPGPTAARAPSDAPLPGLIDASTAVPVRLARPVPLPDFSSIVTTLRGWTSKRSRASRRRLVFFLGCLVIAGAVTAIAIVLANDHASPPERMVSYAQILATRTASDQAMSDAAVSHPPTPNPKAVNEQAPQPPPVMTADKLEGECRDHQTSRKWSDLDQCADKLASIDPKRAEKFKTRATKEASSAPRIASLQAALRDKNLKQARAELDQVWTESVEYADIKRTYDLAEAQAIDDLAAQLDDVMDGSCNAYNQLLAKHRATNLPSITQAAARRVPCVPVPTCDADAFVEQGRKQFSAGQLAQSLASYEAAYSCRPSSAMLQKAFVVACNMRNAAKARFHWKRLSPSWRTPTLASVCTRNAIDEATLNKP